MNRCARIGSIIPVAFACLIALGVSAGCAGGGSEVRGGGTGRASGAGNVLVTDTVEIALPEGWYLALPEEEDEAQISLYDMFRIDNMASGWIGRVPLQSAGDFDWTVETWIASVREFNTSVSVAPASISGRRAKVCSSVTADGSEQRDALIMEGDSIYIVSVVMSPAYFAGNHSVPDMMFRGVRAVSSGRSYRRIPGLPAFSCSDGGFSWYSDLDTAPGWVAFNNNTGSVIAVSMAASFTQSIEEHAASVTENPFTLGFFDARVPIGSEWFDARASGFVSDNSYYLVYHFKRGGQAYLLNLVTAPVDFDKVDFKTIHAAPATREYLKKYLSF